MTINLKKLLERSPRNCANAFNLSLALFIIRVPLGFFLQHLDLSLVCLVALGVSIVVAGLIGYLAYQCGWHPTLAILLPGGLLVPYGGLLISILIFIRSRIFLQKHGYVVGLTSAYENAAGAVPRPDIPFQKHVAWLIIFAAMPWGLFFLVWIINSDYMGKFFMPYGHWLGVAMLLAASVVTVLIYPLGIEFQRLRAEPNFTGVTTVQLGMVVSLAILFALISTGILIMTPAVITMMQQMGPGHLTQ
jgi:hypothetical protein